MSDYQNQSFRLADIGLNLREVSDVLGPGQWVRLDNIDPAQEGSISTRPGRTLLFTTPGTGNVHTIKRIGDDTLLFGVGTELYRDVTLISTGWSGEPLSVVPMSPDLVSSVWTYIGDTAKVRKVNPSGTEYKWGITAPTNVAAFVASTAFGHLDSSVAGAIVYDWRYIYYSTASGAKSNPSPTVNGIAVVGKKGEVTVTASADAQVDQIWIYRRGGTNTQTWRFSFSTANSSGVVVDNNFDSAIALNDAIELDNDVPFTSLDSSGNVTSEVPLPYLAGPFVGKYIIACGDPARPGHVYWTNPGAPDTASPANNVQVTSHREPLLGVFIYSSQPYTWTRDSLYVLDFGGPNALPTFTPRLTPCGDGIVGPHAYTVCDVIYFVSKDGVYMTDGQTPAISISEDTLRPLFYGISVSNFKPIDFTQPDEIHLDVAGEVLYLSYIDTDGGMQLLSYHKLYKRWKMESSDEYFVASIYEDENQSERKIYIGDTTARIFQIDPSALTDNGVAIQANARTGGYDFGAPQTMKEIGNIIVDCDPQGGTIYLTPYTDGEVTTLGTQAITGNGRQKIPLSLSDTFCYQMAWDWAWTGQAKIFQFDILYRLDEEVIKHWEFPPTTHGYSGWTQVRDAYFTIRSSAAITLTIEVDGVADTYTIPSTSNAKMKSYVQLQPRKGKIFRYSLDSTAGFRIYGQECEVRIKPWTMQLGYKLVSPFSPKSLGINGVQDG